MDHNWECWPTNDKNSSFVYSMFSFKFDMILL